MGTSILGVGQSALNAAQIGLTTTGHNIANVNTPGYSRQVVLQGSAGGQDIGNGFVGKGTEVVSVQRVYDEYLTNQVLSSQVTSNAAATYSAQIKQIDNMLADPTAGVASAVQDFFDGMHDVASNPKSDASRQAMLSSANALAARFQSVGGRLDELHQGVNSQITTSLNLINGYAQQIANLNDAIEKAQGTSGENKPANDLLDQRDQIISELSKETKVNVVKQGNSYNVFIGNGQALTVGTQAFKLVPMQSLTDPSKIQVGYQKNGTTGMISDSALPGGKLGGLLDFRANSLEPAQNALGQIAIGLAMTFNTQHELGQDKNGALGGAFFTVGSPVVNPSSTNTSSPAATVTATIVDASQLTTSDYRVQRINGTGGVGVDYVVTRLSDGQTTKFATFPQTIDGITFANPSGTLANSDDYLVQPTIAGASKFGVAVTDIAKIAAAAPIRTVATSANTGSGAVSAGTVNAPPPTDANLQKPVTITFVDATHFNVTGIGTGNPVNVSYTPGANITYNGWTIQISGSPAAGDSFSVESNTNGVGDNRNALQLASLQTKNTLANGNTYQTAYSYMVSQVGNKARELQVTSASEDKLLEQAVQSQQEVSGVNLDEEAANMMRYQQAYQAAAKVMQTAGQLFDLLLTLGQ
ncbi:flagellar hook-associated protein FlgK [Noviherbaspirillum sp.]|jgi:flagellar hook-associated protein 1 FlgK|uniref:flagellar hook-associated protein FlgK n=1 Tax=Noviherbaspirillum sp. TaxID=1926288 RepID=UPI0025D30123|nr:flagellar hook-associated protein FlgK [Noviherbaspirillum sp.]